MKNFHLLILFFIHNPNNHYKENSTPIKILDIK